MIKIVNNPNNLETKDIMKTIDKVRCIIIKNFSVVIINYNDNLMLPGGKVENNESSKGALQRELREELGMDIDTNDLIPFVDYHNYQYNYQATYGNLSRLVRTKYYILRTDKEIDIDSIRLSENEKKYTFDIGRENLLFIDSFIRNFESDNPRYPFFKKELEDIFGYFKKYYFKDELERVLKEAVRDRDKYDGEIPNNSVYLDETNTIKMIKKRSNNNERR